MPEQIKRFGPLQDYLEGTRDQYIHLIKHILDNMHWTQTFMSDKLTEVHQANVLDWIMQNLDPPNPDPGNPCDSLFYTYASKEAIINHFKNDKIIS